MKQKLINDVVQGMLPFLNNAQAERLQDVLQHALWRYEVCETTGGEPEQEQDLVALFQVHASTIRSNTTNKNCIFNVILVCIG